MAMAMLKASKRDAKGSRKVKLLRDKGLLPAIIYGHGIEPIMVAVNLHDFQAAVHKGERLLQLDLDGATQNVLIKEVQYDHMNTTMMHVDMARVNLDERVQVTVPIMLRGTAAGAAEGGIAQLVIADVTLECVVTDIPDDVRVSIADMKIGDMMHLKDLPLPAGAKLIGDGDAIFCTVTVIAEEEVVAVAPAEGGAEPEVIGAKKEEEEGAAGAAEASKEKKEKKE